MKKYIIFLSWLVMSVGMIGCNNDSQFQDYSNISIELMNESDDEDLLHGEVVMQGNDIIWFNQKNSELKLMNNVRVREIPDDGILLFKLSDMELFSAKIMTSTIQKENYQDLVFYKDVENGKFYLYTCYPDDSPTAQSEMNDKIREENWTLFILQLNREGRLK